MKKKTHLNKGTLIVDPDYPEDGVALITEVDPSRRHRFLGSEEIYHVHVFQTASNVWLYKEYVEGCKVLFSTGVTPYTEI
ncbi:hypothetical protein CL629_02170 [bacterium]|nr:hypothetical protein [bacterium]|tara:strand:+ start:3887 stop:4126 length:240 start_codon:yes stop_codon:yes gene_type:complete